MIRLDEASIYRKLGIKKAFVFILLFLSFCMIPTAAQAESKNILILHSYHKGLSWTDSLSSGLAEGLSERSDLVIHNEYLDSKRYPQVDQMETMARFLKSKYRDIRIDILVLVDNNALTFILERRSTLFPNVPIVFAGINGFSDGMIAGQKNITGVLDETEGLETLKIALQLHPQAKAIHVIHDRTVTALLERKRLQNQLAESPLDKPIRYYSNMDTSALLQEVKRIPASDIVLLIAWNRDKLGHYYDYEASSELITKASQAPVFALWDFYLNYGVVGGKMVHARTQGLSAAKLILRVLEGQSASSLPIIRDNQNRLLFDFRQLLLFGIDKKLLPKGSMVLFDPMDYDPTKMQDHPSTYRIGVLANRGETDCLKRWHATADYLSRNIKNSHFKIVPLDFDDLLTAVKDRTIDFVLTNPVHYIELEYEYGIRRITTIVSQMGDTQTVFFGGVIFTRSDMANLFELKDLVGKQFAAVDASSLGGWLAAKVELKQNGIDAEKDFKTLSFGGSHYAVVNAVLGGEADAGTVRTDTLERMAKVGKIQMSDIRVLNPKSHMTFPFVHSTALYPEWPFAALSHVPLKIMSLVAAALMNIDSNDKAATDAQIAGWTAPLHYESVSSLLRNVRYGPFRDYGKVSMWEVIKQNWLAGVFAIALLMILLVFSIRLTISNRNLMHTTDELKTSREQFMLAVNGSQDGIWDLDLRTDVLFLSSKWKEMLGYRDDELANLYKSLLDNIHPDDIKPFNENLDDYLRGKKDRYSIEFRMKHKDGHYVDIHSRGEAIRDEEGRPYRMAGSHTDISERKKAEKALEENEARLAAITNAAQDAIIMIDTDGNVAFWNPSAESILGYRAEEMIGKNFHEIIAPKKYLAAHHSAFQKFKKSGQGDAVGKTLELEAIRNDGKEISVSLSLSSVLIEDQWHAIGLIRDISDQKRAQAQLLETNRQLENANIEAHELAMKAEVANTAKSQFLANMSHEIRTPMNAVVGMADLLLDMDLSQRQQEYVSVIAKSADSLLSLINDILDYSKIEADRLDIEEIEFNLRTLVEDISDIVAIRAYEKRLEFVSFLPPEVPTRLIGDPGRLRQILTNLANNAVKFTNEGEVSIHVRAVEQNDPNVLLRFDIRDTGIGLSLSEKEKLFQPFTQADSSTTRRFGGTGLGLSISKRLSELMGGEIGVDSQPGHGSTFWFTVRMKMQADQPPDKMEQLPGDIRSVRILGVDDNDSNRMVLQAMLESWDCRFEIVENGTEALRRLEEAQLKNDPYGIVLLDMAMPDVDGAEIGRTIRNSTNMGNPILVMLTSVGRKGDAAILKDIGFNAYLTKPIKRSQLFDCLVTAISENNIDGKQPKTDKLITRHSLAEKKTYEMKALLVEDNPFNQMVAQEILGKMGFTVSTADNGKIAVERLCNNRFDLVFMDMQMPEMDGLEATRLIRSEASSVLQHDIPIIAMTANAMKGDREACMEAGMDDYLSKPINKGELKHIINKVIEKTKRAHKQPNGLNQENTSLVEDSLFDESALLERLSGDEELMRTILTAFVEDVGAQIQKLKDLFETTDLVAIKRQAHSIKGAAGNAGAMALYEMALKIENYMKDGDSDKAYESFNGLTNEFELVVHLLEKKGWINA